MTPWAVLWAELSETSWQHWVVFAAVAGIGSVWIHWWVRRG